MIPDSQKADSFPLSEKKARAQLGITRDEIRALRNAHLTEGTHYIRGKQQSVWLNQAGLDALLSTRSLPTGERAGEGTAREIQPVKEQLLNVLDARVEQLEKTRAEIRLRVVNGNLQFKHMLIACAFEDDFHRPAQPVRVRVNNNANFVRGMEIPVRRVDGYTDLYELTRKCPRQKGKW